MEWLSALVAILVVVWAVLWPGQPWLDEWCIRSAVRRLPKELQAEQEEAWRADLRAAPNGIWHFKWSLGIILAADNIQRLFNANLQQIDELNKLVSTSPTQVLLKTCKSCKKSLTSNVKSCIHCGAAEPFENLLV